MGPRFHVVITTIPRWVTVTKVAEVWGMAVHEGVIAFWRGESGAMKAAAKGG